MISVALAPPLARPVTVESGAFCLGELLERLQKQLGRELTCGERVSGVRVRGGWTAASAHDALDEIAAQLGPDARWETVEGGWHLSAPSPRSEAVPWRVHKALRLARNNKEPLSTVLLAALVRPASAEALAGSDDSYLRQLAPWRALLLKLRDTPGLRRRMERGEASLDELSEALAPLRTRYPDGENADLDGVRCRFTVEEGQEDGVAQPILCLSIQRGGATLWLATLPLTPGAPSAPSAR